MEEEFAQTRMPDDLFDDDFISENDGYDESLNPQTSTYADPEGPIQDRAAETGPRRQGDEEAQTVQEVRTAADPPPRFDSGNSENFDPSQNLTTSQHDENLQTDIITPTVKQEAGNVDNSSLEAAQDSRPGELPTKDSEAPVHSNTGRHTSSGTPRPTVPPVRGDRHLTGGLAKPKLTEEELSAKMAAARLNNAKRAEAHRLAEADEALFQQREEKASVRRLEEGQARRRMDLEREKNRMRKLGTQAGREWDEGKEEMQNDRDHRHSQYRRGANGGMPRGRVMEKDGDQPGSGHAHDSMAKSGRGAFAYDRGGRGFGRARGHPGFEPRAGAGEETTDERAEFQRSGAQRKGILYDEHTGQGDPRSQQAFPPLPNISHSSNRPPISPQRAKDISSWADQVTAEANG